MTPPTARRAAGAMSALVALGLAGALAAAADAAATAYDPERAFDIESLVPAGLGLPPRDVPVLLVPGWLDTARDLAALRIRLIGAGWPADHVETLTFEDPTGSNRDHAVELAAAVERLRQTTGAGEVDIVAHSMGGLAARWYLRHGGEAPIRRVVFLASPHR
ncbi:MAG: alpha/beta fold hydrolase, partial [Gemmatimonadetes bacterium]|nr:alpha/beta fold hydrolase [Gemmatimonadota bacterium]